MLKPTRHEYRLSGDTKAKTMSLEGIHLSHEWGIFNQKIKKLERHVQGGMVEYRLFVKPSEMIKVEKSKSRFKKKSIKQETSDKGSENDSKE